MNEYRFPIRVYFEDTDAGGVVYYACYVNFYERARTEMLRQHNLNQSQFLIEHVAFAVKHLDVQYLLPARLDDELEVQSRITMIRGASLSYAQQIVNSDGDIISKADVLVACVDLYQMKPVALPKSVVAAFRGR